jgi:hypothetical protein
MTRKTYSHYKWTVPPPNFYTNGGTIPCCPRARKCYFL